MSRLRHLLRASALALAGASCRALAHGAVVGTATIGLVNVNGNMPYTASCTIATTDPGWSAFTFSPNVVYQAGMAPYAYQRFSGTGAPAGTSYSTQDAVLHIMMPTACTSSAKCPVVLQIHGGGWASNGAVSSLDPTNIPATCTAGASVDVNFCAILYSSRLGSASLGSGHNLGWVYIEYPLQDSTNYYKNYIPDQVGALLCAARWLVTNGVGYGIDANRMLWQGYSAGGNLAAEAGITENAQPSFSAMSAAIGATGGYEGGGGYDHPNCTNTATLPAAKGIVAFYGFHHPAATGSTSSSIFARALNITDSTKPGITRNGFNRYQANYPLIKKYDNYFNVSSSSPPIYIARGLTDGVSQWYENYDLYYAANAAGVPNAMFQVTSQGHGYYPFNQGNTAKYQAEDCSLLAFYNQVLTP